MKVIFGVLTIMKIVLDSIKEFKRKAILPEDYIDKMCFSKHFKPFYTVNREGWVFMVGSCGVADRIVVAMYWFYAP